MALRRSLSLRSLFTARSYQPTSCSSIVLRHEEEKPSYSAFLHQRSFSSSVLSKHLGRSSSHLSPFGVSIFRSLSTSVVPGSDESVGDVNHVTDSVLQDVSIDSVVNYDVVQKIIDNVHSFTGLNWWASIVLTTLLIRGVTIPLMIYDVRWNARMLGGDPAVRARHMEELHKLVMKYGGHLNVNFYLSRFYLGMLILQNYAWICMGERIHDITGLVASFKTGGMLWFTDLTTADTSFIFPLLTGLAFLITVECDAMVGLEGIIFYRKQGRCFVIPVVLVGMFFSKAVHCYLMGCMLFSIAFLHVVRRPAVMKQLSIPEVPEYLPIMLLKNKSAIARDPKEKIPKS